MKSTKIVYLTINHIMLKIFILLEVEKLHIQTLCQKKKALDRNDDKRILIPGTFATYAIGHYATKK